MCFDLLLTPFPYLLSLAILNGLIDILSRIALLHSSPWNDIRTLIGRSYFLAQARKQCSISSHLWRIQNHVYKKHHEPGLRVIDLRVQVAWVLYHLEKFKVSMTVSKIL